MGMYPHLWTIPSRITLFCLYSSTGNGFEVNVSLPLRHLGVVEYQRIFHSYVWNFEPQTSTLNC